MKPLRQYQEDAVVALLQCRRGLIKASPGAGKTWIAASAVSRWLDANPGAKKVMWLTPTIDICAQGREACELFGLPARCTLEIACYAALKSAADVDLLVLDEAHCAVATEFAKAWGDCTGVIWGFTATPVRTGESKDAVFELIGPIVFEVEREQLVADGNLAKAQVYFHAPNERDEFAPAIEEAAAEGAEKMSGAVSYNAMLQSRKSIEQVTRMLGREIAMQAIMTAEAFGIDTESPVSALLSVVHPAAASDVRGWLTAAAKLELLSRARWHACQEQGIFANEKRNAEIVRLAAKHITAGDSVLILVGSIQHGCVLRDRIDFNDGDPKPLSRVLHSKMGAKKRRDALEAFRDGSLKCAIATSLADLGLDVPRANVLILAAAGRSAAKAEQRTGRVLRAWRGE